MQSQSKPLKVDGERNSNKDLSPSTSNKTMKKFWCGTSFYNNETDKINLINLIKNKSFKYIIGFETCPTTNREHLQWYIEYKSKRGACFDTMKKIFPTSHIEICKYSLDANFKYCSKSNNFITNIKKNKELKIIKPESFYPWQKYVINIINNDADDRLIYWFWELEGCCGKTSIAKYICVNYNAICISGKSSDCKNGIIQYKKDKGLYPDIIIFNIPRCNSNHISYEALETIKDGLFYSGKYEGGMCICNNPHIIIFANEEPETYKLTENKWSIINISKFNEYNF